MPYAVSSCVVWLTNLHLILDSPSLLLPFHHGTALKLIRLGCLEEGFFSVCREKLKEAENIYVHTRISNELIHVMSLYKFMYVIISRSCLRHSR